MANERDRAMAGPAIRRHISLSVVLLALGVGLVFASFFPIGQLATDHLWTTDDSIAYDRISLEYHRAALEPTPRAGRTDEESAEYLANLKRQFTAMQEQLQRARRQPPLWSRYLMWAGALLAAAGVLSHLREG